MLEFMDKENGAYYKFYIVDGHHHLGADVDGQSNRNPAAPGGTFDFCFKITSQLLRILADGKVDLKAEPHGFLKEILEQEDKWKDVLNGTWAVDKTVVFPFNDEFRWREGDEGKATYWRSNDNIHRWTARAPYSFKLTGYARIVPHEGDVAVRELHRAVEELGLRGLKLHPRSDGWGGEINTDPVERVLVEAAKLGIPVIFDTRGFNQVVDIAEVTVKAKLRLANIDKRLAKRLKVILAHVGFHVGHDELFSILSHPNIYGETSGVHDAGIRRLFEEASVRLSENLGPYRRWSEKLIFGTDFPYFDVPHAVQFISYVLSEDFPGTFEDAQRILGVNVLRLIPPKLERAPFKLEAVHFRRELAPMVKRKIALELANLASNKKCDVTSFDPFLQPPPRANVREDCVISIRSMNGDDKKASLMFFTIRGIGVIARLDSELTSLDTLLRRELAYDDSPLRQRFYNKLWPSKVEREQAQIEEKIRSILKPLFEKS
nr:hypothetical protein [Candidatus Bathyarchaeota archaeon]